MTVDTLIAASAALAAIVSAFFAYRSADTAKRALKLGEVDFREKHDSLMPYLIDAVTWESGESRMASFACSLTNGATIPNTLTRIDLMIRVYDKQGVLSEIIINPTIGNTPPKWDITSLPTPLNLQPRSTVSGWISFKLPNNFYENWRVDAYQVLAITSTGEKITLDAYILKTIAEEDE